MVDCLVFSKDRASQLDLLARSIVRHAGDLYRRVSVLYTFSSAAFLRGYQRFYAETELELELMLEHDFEGQVRAWLDNAGPLVSFLVDDDVFYRDVPALDWGQVPLSLRGGDYDYPFSLDGNIYRRSDVSTLLAELAGFSNPTELEHAAHLARERLPFQWVNAVEPPCLVGVPANRVSRSSGMPHFGISVDTLNAAYLAGGRLELEHDGTPLYTAHAVLRYLLDGEPVTARSWALQ